MIEERPLYEIVKHTPNWLYAHYVAPPLAKAVRMFKRNASEEELFNLEAKIYNFMNGDNYLS